MAALKYKHPHLDEAHSIMFTRNLEQVRAKAYNVKFPNFKAKMLIPVDSEIDPGVEVIKYEQYTEVGIAKIISDYAQDLPRADVKGKEFTSTVKTIATSYGYSLQEARAAAYAKKALKQLKANAARRANDLKVDQLARNGDASYGLLGLLNQPNATTYVIPNGAAGDTEWTTKTPDEILADMNGIAAAIVESTLEVEIPDTIILPTAQYNLIAGLSMGDGRSQTVLKYFLETNPYIKEVISWWALNQAGTASADRMVCYRRDPDALQLIIPLDFEQLPPQDRALETVIPCDSRFGGVVLYYPLSMAYGDGI